MTNDKVKSYQYNFAILHNRSCYAGVGVGACVGVGAGFGVDTGVGAGLRVSLGELLLTKGLRAQTRSMGTGLRAQALEFT